MVGWVSISVTLGSGADAGVCSDKDGDQIRREDVGEWAEVLVL